MTTVVKRALTRKNVDAYRTAFKKCFPGTSWKASVPFPEDPIYAAVEDGAIVGFCMVHDSPPQKMPQGPGAYMYNLCVVPEARRRGVGTAIMLEVARDNPQCYAHMEQIDPVTGKATGANQAFMARLGWQRVGALRQYYEYALLAGGQLATSLVDQSAVDQRQYDAENNVIYLDA